MRGPLSEVAAGEAWATEGQLIEGRPAIGSRRAGRRGKGRRRRVSRRVPPTDGLAASYAGEARANGCHVSAREAGGARRKDRRRQAPSTEGRRYCGKSRRHMCRQRRAGGICAGNGEQAAYVPGTKSRRRHVPATEGLAASPPATEGPGVWRCGRRRHRPGVARKSSVFSAVPSPPLADGVGATSSVDVVSRRARHPASKTGHASLVGLAVTAVWRSGRHRGAYAWAASLPPATVPPRAGRGDPPDLRCRGSRRVPLGTARMGAYRALPGARGGRRTTRTPDLRSVNRRWRRSGRGCGRLAACPPAIRARPPP